MELTEFARAVLCSADLEVKLHAPADSSNFSDRSPRHGWDLPVTPARSPGLGFSDAELRFPEQASLASPDQRAVALHFFANHELMALELMALALLKFVDAPQEFRVGIAETMVEEQRHFRLYRARLRELGVEFGDLGLSAFFWNALSGMKSPTDYVTQLSMTFEQANLDYAIHYRDLFASFEDPQSAAIMDEIYRDEIRHLAFGVRWFNRWRPSEMDLWQAHREALPATLSPAWAKGIGFSAEGRRRAGLPEAYIRQLRVYSRGKRRPPRLFFFNPDPAELNAARRADLAPLMLFVAARSDILFCRRPTLDFLEQLHALRVPIPEIIEADPGDIPAAIADRPRLFGFCPWRWDPGAEEIYAAVADKVLPVGQRPAQPRMVDPTEIAAACAARFGDHVDLGATVGAPGESQRDGEQLICRLAFHFDVGRDAPRKLRIARECAGDGWQLSLIGKPWRGLPESVMRFLSVKRQGRTAPRDRMRELGSVTREELAARGYHGPARLGIRVVRAPAGLTWRLESCAAQYTLGQIACRLEGLLLEGRVGGWLQVDTAALRAVGFDHPPDFVAYLRAALPLATSAQGTRVRVSRGVIATNDPAQCREVLTLLAVAPRVEELAAALAMLPGFGRALII